MEPHGSPARGRRSDGVLACLLVNLEGSRVQQDLSAVQILMHAWARGKISAGVDSSGRLRIEAGPQNPW